METLDILDNLEYLRTRNQAKKFYKKRRNPFLEYSDEEFRIKYRFSKENSRKLIRLVWIDLNGEEKRGGSIPPHIQVLAALRCWGQDHAQADCAEYHGFSQSTMSRICTKVALAFAKKAKSLIKMAASAEEQMTEMEKFKQIAGLKNAIGAIGCTQIRIQAVGADAQSPVNRKEYFSLNVQVVCDASLNITDMVSCWKGGTHDCKIFDDSKIKSRFEEGAFMGRLIGNGSYKCTEYLFTPVQNPKNTKEAIYNKAHRKTRGVVESLFRIWKSRFRFLLGRIRISRKNGKVLIVALAVLHNLSIMYKEKHFDDDVQSYGLGCETLYDDSQDDNICRDIYIQQHF